MAIIECVCDRCVCQAVAKSWSSVAAYWRQRQVELVPQTQHSDCDGDACQRPRQYRATLYLAFFTPRLLSGWIILIPASQGAWRPFLTSQLLPVAAGAGGQLTPQCQTWGSLTPNIVWVMWCWCFCPALRSTFSYLKRIKIQDFNQKCSEIFRGCYNRSAAAGGRHTLSLPAHAFWLPIF